MAGSVGSCVLIASSRLPSVSDKTITSLLSASSNVHSSGPRKRDSGIVFPFEYLPPWCEMNVNGATLTDSICMAGRRTMKRVHREDRQRHSFGRTPRSEVNFWSLLTLKNELNASGIAAIWTIGTGGRSPNNSQVKTRLTWTSKEWLLSRVQDRSSGPGVDGRSRSNRFLLRGSHLLRYNTSTAVVARGMTPD